MERQTQSKERTYKTIFTGLSLLLASLAIWQSYNYNKMDDEYKKELKQELEINNSQVPFFMGSGTVSKWIDCYADENTCKKNTFFLWPLIISI